MFINIFDVNRCSLYVATAVINQSQTEPKFQCNVDIVGIKASFGGIADCNLNVIPSS